MADSVVLNFTTPKHGAGRHPRVLWNETFHQTVEKDRDRKKESEKEKARERDSEEDERGAPPERVKGLGQEAFWIASRVGGALYVLRDDYQFFRISVGGGDNATAKLNKSKKLAQLVLKKLGPLVPEG
jgi:hypothetical protein